MGHYSLLSAFYARRHGSVAPMQPGLNSNLEWSGIVKNAYKPFLTYNDSNSVTPYFASIIVNVNISPSDSIDGVDTRLWQWNEVPYIQIDKYVGGVGGFISVDGSAPTWNVNIFPIIRRESDGVYLKLRHDRTVAQIVTIYCLVQFNV